MAVSCGGPPAKTVVVSCGGRPAKTAAWTAAASCSEAPCRPEAASCCARQGQAQATARSGSKMPVAWQASPSSGASAARLQHSLAWQGRVPTAAQSGCSRHAPSPTTPAAAQVQLARRQEPHHRLQHSLRPPPLSQHPSAVQGWQGVARPKGRPQARCPSRHRLTSCCVDWADEMLRKNKKMQQSNACTIVYGCYPCVLESSVPLPRSLLANPSTSLSLGCPPLLLALS